MESNNLNKREINKSNHLSLPNYKFNKNVNVNKRYQNTQKKPLNLQNSTISNSSLLYGSYQRKGYNGIIDPSLLGNNNFLVIKSLGVSPYQNQKNNLIAKKSFTKGNRTEISKSQLIKNSRQKTTDNKKNIFQNNNSETDNILKWNNIGFKEVKYKNQFDISSSNLKKNNSNILFKSYQQYNRDK